MTRIALLNCPAPQVLTVGTIRIIVLSYAGTAPSETPDTCLRTSSGQDIVIKFNYPSRPATALRDEACAALEPIPQDVAYPD